jgi:hypothetical protein
MKAFASEIYAAVRAKRLKQPFSAEAAKSACPGWAERTYQNFFNKHRVGNPSGTTELFIRVSPGQFELKIQTDPLPPAAIVLR